MDRQDAQDWRDLTLLRVRFTQALIRPRLADSQDYKTPDSQNQILYILFIHVIQNSWIDRMRRIKRSKPTVKFKGDSTNSGPNH